MHNLTIAARLAWGFGAILVLMIAITVFGVQRVSVIDRLLVEVNEGATAKQRFAINFRGSVHDRAISLRDATLVTTPSDLATHLSDVERLEAFYQESARPMDRLFAETMVSSQEERLLDEIKDVERRAKLVTERLIALKNSGETDQAQRYLLSDVSPLYTEWLGDINAFIDYQEQIIRNDISTVQDIAETFGQVMIVITLLATVLGAVIAGLIVQSFRRKLGAEPFEVADVMHRLSSGDLKVKRETQYSESVMAAVNGMVERLSSIISEVRTAADEVSSSSSSMQESSSNTSVQMQHQSAETEQMATAIEEMAATVKDVSDMASKADAIAGEVGGEVQHGDAVVRETAQAMSELSTILEEAASTVASVSSQSANIEKIIEVINAIAEQTNLLALNAAIEAARAGEHGRGFAVVADEVRSLASRTQESTREISTMIGQLQQGAADAAGVMERSRTMASQTRERTEMSQAALDSIRQRVLAITEMNTQIANAAEQQSDVAQEVSKNISRIRDLTQETTKSSGVVEGLSSDLMSVSKRLSEKVSFFR